MSWLGTICEGREYEKTLHDDGNLQCDIKKGATKLVLKKTRKQRAEKSKLQKRCKTKKKSLKKDYKK